MTLIQQPVLDPRAAIAETNQRFMSSFARQDAASIAALYTEQGELLPPGSAVVQGHSAIQQFWQGAMSLGIRRARLETVELETSGTTAAEIGRYFLFDESDTEVDRGKYLVIWQQDGGSWKLHRDIWNSSMPAAG